MIKVLYFASLREEVGIGEEQIELDDAIRTMGDLRAHLAARGDVWAQAFVDGRTLMMALNQEAADSEACLKAGDEAAFFPPVTGG